MITLRITKKIAAAALAAAVTASAFSITALAAGDRFKKDETVKVSSNKLIAYLDESEFGLVDSAENLLLYEGASIGLTSRCYLKVDDNIGVIGELEANADDENNVITTKDTYRKIQFDRTLTLMGAATPDEADTLEVRAKVTNTDEESHEVGLRVMLDTMLGNNDDAPFRSIEGDEITTRKQFEGEDIPMFYQVFDDLLNPQIITEGKFLGGSMKPDIVQFNNYAVSSKSTDNFIPKVEEELNIGDSVVNAIWNPVTLAPGETKEYVLYYGLSSLDVSSDTDLVLGATKVTKNFVINEDETGYNKVNIVSYVQNKSDIELSDITVSLDLPEGVTTFDGSTERKVASLPVNSVKQQKWQLVAEPSGYDRTVSVTIKANCEQTGDATPITYTYLIPGIESLIPEESSEDESSEESTEESSEESVEESSEESSDVQGEESEVSDGESSAESETSEESEASQTSETSTESEQGSTTSGTASSTASTTTTTTSTTTTTGTTSTVETFATGAAVPAFALLTAIAAAAAGVIFISRKKKSED